MKKISLLVIGLIFLSSCDALIGEDGVVVDSETGERIANVVVKMESDVGLSATDVTDSIGYFNTVEFIGCGLGDCDDYYLLTFKKEGYQTTTIDKYYFRDPNTEYVTEGMKDTLIVKMQLE